MIYSENRSTGLKSMRCLQELQAAALQIGDRLRTLQDELCVKEKTLNEMCEKHQDARQQIEARSSQVQ